MRRTTGFKMPAAPEDDKGKPKNGRSNRFEFKLSKEGLSFKGSGQWVKDKASSILWLLKLIVLIGGILFGMILWFR